MQDTREFGLIPNRSTPDQYLRLARWEGKWVPCVDEEGLACEEYTLTPVTWEWSLLEVRRDGNIVKRWVPTRISSARPAPPPWPRGLSGETETLRRARIRVLRLFAHVDASKGIAEPAWVEEPSAAAQ